MTVSPTRPKLNLPEMDAQHDYLYSLFDLIGENRQVGDLGRMKVLLGEIERYVMFHFESEERLMRAYGYPGFAVHQDDHEQAGNRLVAFLDDFDSDRLNPAALRIFLTGWLMEHSRISDSEYAKYIQDRRREVFS